MKDYLLPHSVAVNEIDCLKEQGEPVSASRVHALLDEDRLEEIRPLAPPITYQYLLHNFGGELLPQTGAQQATRPT